MKTCEHCGEEIGTRDGDNRCSACDIAEANGRRRQKARQARRLREQVYTDMGLTKVKGALGGTYWE